MQENFLTSIEYALETQNRELFTLLLKDFRSFKKKDRNEILTETVLKAEDTDFIETVLSLGGDIAYKDEEGNTLLHYAAVTSRPETVTFFLQKGLDLEAKNEHGATPLCLAARESESIAVIKTLIEAGAGTSVRANHGETLLIAAAGSNPNPKVTEFFIRQGFNTEDRTEDGYTAFLNAARWQSNADVLFVLVEANADIYAVTLEEENAFHLAAYNENEGPAFYIASLFSSSDITKRGVSCFEGALMYAKTPEVLSIYMQRMREEHVQLACLNKNPRILETLILSGYDVNNSTAGGMTALMMAAKNNMNPDIITMLLHHQAIFNNKDSKGRTPLHYAAANTDTAIYEWMLADDRFKQMEKEADSDGHTPDYYRAHQDEF